VPQIVDCEAVCRSLVMSDVRRHDYDFVASSMANDKSVDRQAPCRGGNYQCLLVMDLM
jgi:hypothetical protein